MNKNDIERILRLQQSAFEFLLWLNARAAQEQEILSDENLEKWRFAENCEMWVREFYGMIPQALRPEENDIPAFARLFSSFFLTSFHLVENAPVAGYFGYGYEASGKRKLMSGSPAGKKSAKGKSRVRESARELCLIALEELAHENEMLPGRADLERLEGDDSLRDALVLWTYIHELNRRANFASQGEAVRSLWQAMDRKDREKIKADQVLQAHARLVAALKSV